MSAFHLTRRMRMLALVASAGVTLATITACSAPAAAPRTAPAAPLSSQVAAPAAPRYFVDLVSFSGAAGGQLQVRLSSTGRLSEQPGTLALAVAPLRGTSVFVVAERAGSGCVSALYRMTISAAGRLGPATALGRVVPGAVTSLAAAGSGRTIAFFASPCSKSASGYLGVLDVRSGNLRHFGDVSIDGSRGSIAAGGSVSLSADGRLAAFAGYATAAGQRITGARLWVLRTSAPAGTLARRSRVVLARPASGPALDAVLLSPDGRTFYLCAVSTRGTGTTGGTGSVHHAVTQTTVITARRTSDGARTGTVATLKATGVTFQGEFLGCPMAASPAGNYLLVPYSLRYARVAAIGPLVRAARIDVATKARTLLSFRLPGTAGMSVATGVGVAW